MLLFYLWFSIIRCTIFINGSWIFQ